MLATLVASKPSTCLMTNRRGQSWRSTLTYLYIRG